MKRVTGIGGIFFNANDPVALRAWYKQHLGIDVQEWGGTAFTWTDAAGNPTKGTTVWSIGAADGKHFAPSKSTFMVNYRVEDLAACFSRFGTKDVTSWRRRTTPSTGSSVGSWILRATRSNSGSHLRDSEFRAWWARRAGQRRRTPRRSSDCSG